MPKSQCLTKELLQDYLRGSSNDILSEEIETHVESCRECEQVLQTLEANSDSFLDPLRGESLEKLIAGPELDRALVASKNLLATSSSTRDPSSVEEWPRQLGGYKLLEPLGRGGMGSVFLAIHEKLKKHVAIKVLPSFLLRPNDAQQRFDREILAAGQLDHPAIVRATDAGQVSGTHFLVMEYIKGLDLSRLTKAVGPLKIADACEVARQAALGLSYAHSQGMVHRDIKPSNLMLDGNGKVKILDFGLVLFDRWDAPAQELTTVGQLMGTLDYMAPEQAERSGGVDHRADLYSLGATLFRMLCGRAPLMATPNQSPLEKLRLLIHHQPPSLKTMRPDAPTALVELVDGLLSADPTKRHPSAAHVAEALSPFANGADLKLLLEAAQNAVVAEEAIESPIRFERPSKFVDIEGEPLAPNPNLARSRFGGRFTRWAGLMVVGLLPFAIWAGYILILETQNGQLVIESEIADIKVKILRDGKPVKDLSIVPGTQVSKLLADQYEITLESPSDQVTIENGAFTLRRGEVVVARIRKQDRKVAKSPDPAVIPNRESNSQVNPVYEGKTLKEWLALLQTERSDEKIADALKAIATLKSKEEGEEVEKAILECLSNRENLSFNTTMLAFDGLSKNKSPEAFIEQLSKVFRVANEMCRGRILTYASSRFYNDKGSYDPDFNEKNWTPLIESVRVSRLESDAQGKWNASLERESFKFCTNLLWFSDNNVNFESIHHALECIDVLSNVPDKDWLELAGKLQLYEQREWQPRLLEFVRKEIALILSDEKADQSLLESSIYILRRYGAGGEYTTRKLLAGSFGRRLDLTSVQWKEPRKGSFIAVFGPIPVENLSGRNGGGGGVAPLGFSILDYLQLCRSLPLEERPTKALKRISEITKPEYEVVINALETMPIHKELGRLLRVTWPAFLHNFDPKSLTQEQREGVKPEMILGYVCHLLATELVGEPAMFTRQLRWNPMALPVKLDADGAIRELTPEEQAEFEELATQFVVGDKNGDGFIDTNGHETLGITSRQLSMPQNSSYAFSEILQIFDLTWIDSMWIDWSEHKIASLDKNHDGKLQEEEWSPELGDFATIDKNKNGYVMVGELAIRKTTNPRAAAKAISAKPTYADDSWWSWCEKQFEKLDRNKSGEIELAEFSSSIGEFSAIDADQSGSITLLEFYRFKIKRGK